jgi:hypothetical protein
MALKTLTKTPVSDYPASINPFIKSLFSKGVRSESIVIGAAHEGHDTVSFCDDASRQLIMESWLAAWKVYAGEDGGDWKAYVRENDQNLINFLAGYIKEHGLGLCRRKIELSSASIDPKASGVPFYRNTAYTRQSFLNDKNEWSYGTLDDSGKPNGDGVVTEFLWLLFHGAHMVVITVDDDGASGFNTGFDSSFNDTFDGAHTSSCPRNTHYASSTGGDDYYLDIADDKPPEDPSFILALLVGDTSTGESNGFLQLEGWQAHASWSLDGGDWHHNDYQTHTATLWNISTFGASAYSEKRLTPVFLAQKSFPLAIDPQTHMPLYDGAGSLQDWMEPGYITGGSIDEALIDVHDDLGHLYFFQGTQVIHYDPSKKAPHANYPQPIENIFPGLAAEGFDTIDAAYGVPADRTNGGMYYFFKGEWYIHYDPSKPSAQRVVSKHKITGAWPGITFTSVDGVAYDRSSDASKDRIHFFKGNSYQRFDVKENMAGHAAQADVSVGAAEIVYGKLLLFQNDEVVSWDRDAYRVDWDWGAAAIYGRNVFPKLWWGSTSG